MSFGAVAGVLLLLLVPGVPACLALHRPGRISVVSRLALAPVLGAALAGGVAFVLALAGLLGRTQFLVLMGLASVALTVWVSRRDGLRAHWRADVAEARADPWPILLGFAVVAGIAIVRLSFTPEIHFSAASAWRYWADAVEVADAGGIPEASLQYGIPLVPTVSKAFLNALNAAASYVIGRDALPALGALLWVGSVGLAGVLWALGRELGLRLTAPLLPVLVVANRELLNPETTTDLDAYRAETFGRMLALGGLVLVIRALRDRRGWTDALAGGALVGVAVGMHLVPAIVAALIAAGFGAASLLRDPARRAGLTRGLAAAGVAGAVAGAILLLPEGDVGLSGVRGDDVYARFGASFDPTLFVNAGVAPEVQAAEGPRDWSLSPGDAYQAFVATSIGESSGQGLRPSEPSEVVDPLGVAMASIGVVLAGLGLAWFPRTVRPAALVPVVLAAGLVGLTWWFSQRSDLFIPAKFGLRRLYDYSAVPLVIGGLIVVELVVVFAGRVRRWATTALAVALVVGLSAWLLPDARLRPSRVEAVRPLIQEMRWAAQHLPCDALILSNQHTEGFFQAGLGRAALLEGATPYLRPKVLDHAIDLFLRARAFFRDPSAATFLSGWPITHVVVIRGGGLGYSAVVGKTDVAALDRLSFLRLEHATDAVRIYSVQLPGTGGPGVRAEAYPGYHCARDPAF